MFPISKASGAGTYASRTRMHALVAVDAGMEVVTVVVRRSGV